MAANLTVFVDDGPEVPASGIDIVGVVDEGSSSSRSYEMINDGDASLTISDVVFDSDFLTLTTNPESEVVSGGGGFTPMVFSLSTSDPGTINTTVTVTHTGPNSPYEFTLRWQVAANVTLTARQTRTLRRLLCDRAAWREIVAAINSGIPTAISGRAKRAIMNGMARHNPSLIASVQTGSDTSDRTRRWLAIGIGRERPAAAIADEVDRSEP